MKKSYKRALKKWDLKIKCVSKFKISNFQITLFFVEEFLLSVKSFHAMGLVTFI